MKIEERESKVGRIILRIVKILEINVVLVIVKRNLI